MSEGGAPALKGLRLLTIDRGPEGYGFHMYTNRQLKGQYIKWVSPNGPADLSGLLPGDHVIEVDGIDVATESHHKVVECIRAGDGKGKKILVIDQDTDKELRDKEEEIVASNAVVMIPRTPIRPPPNAEPPKSPIRAMSPGSDETDGGPVSPRSPVGGAPLKKSERVKVKQRDWRSSIEAYNAL